LRFNYSAKQEVMNRYIAFSNEASSSAQAQGMTGTTQLIWPESPFSVLSDPRSRCAGADQ